MSRRARLQAAGLALAVAAGAAGCSGGGGSSTPAAPAPGRVNVQVTAGPVQVEQGGTAPGALSDQDRDAVIDVVRRFVTAATLDPLAGKPVGDLAPLFSTAAAPGLTGADRAALVDDGLPEATGRTTATVAPVGLTALSDAGGSIGLVGATLALDVSARTGRGPVTIKRSGELVLAHAPDGWKIDSYRLLVARDGAGLGPSTPPTSAASSS